MVSGDFIGEEIEELRVLVQELVDIGLQSERGEVGIFRKVLSMVK
jgi:hypothetical protein